MRATLLLLLLPLAPLAAAGGDDYPTEEPATGFHTQKKMTRGPDGLLHLTYLEGEKVIVARVEGDGRWTRLPEVQAARGGQSRSSITFDAEGTLHLAWTERADEDREVFAARLEEGAWVGVTQLSRGEGYAGFPSLAADAEGRVHVAWYGFDGTFYQTFHRLWENGAWGAPTQLSAGPLDANNPSVVVAADGTAHVAWYKDEGRRYSVWHAQRAADGHWSLPQRLPGAGTDALNVALALDASGTLHAAWDERHEDGARVLHATLGEDGWARPTTLASAAAAGEYAAMAAWGEGVLVAWTARNGSIVATDLATPPTPLHGIGRGTHVGLRGAQAAPEGDRAAALDVLWTAPDNTPRLAHVADGCSPFAPCAPREAPWPAVGALLACILVAISRWIGHDH